MKDAPKVLSWTILWDLSRSTFAKMTWLNLLNMDSFCKVELVGTPFFAKILAEKLHKSLPAKFHYIYGGYIVAFNRPAHFDNRRKFHTFWPHQNFGGKYYLWDKTQGWQQQSKLRHYLGHRGGCGEPSDHLWLPQGGSTLIEKFNLSWVA